MGVSFTVQKSAAGEVAASHEFLRIHIRGGKTVYSALPSGQALTDFELKSQAAGTVTFENLQHDFPQRITYMRRGADSLLVRIEGDREGRRRARLFAFRRATCPRGQ